MKATLPSTTRGARRPRDPRQVSEMAGYVASNYSSVRWLRFTRGLRHRDDLPEGYHARTRGAELDIIGYRSIEGRTPEPGVIGRCQVDEMAVRLLLCSREGAKTK